MVQVLKSWLVEPHAEQIVLPARPKWSVRSAATLPFLSDLQLQPTAKLFTHFAQICINDQLVLQDIELQGSKESASEIQHKLPWVLIDDEQHTAPVLQFRSEPCRAHLRNTLANALKTQEIKPNHHEMIARWKLFVSEVRITPVEHFWHDTTAIVQLCLNNEIEIQGIRVQENKILHWPNALSFVDPALCAMLEASIQSAIARQ
jgi:hypothetical protein